ncbi:MAG: 1,4-dihydroxy-2-naphthoate polyprenyltransferase [Chloroflexi bacterium]|nr:1,4-dihydroxy-2-naphthoate polyprenyltransferase [Chloroflexota bacterium]
MNLPITRIQAWWIAARPRTLPAAATPIAVGTALAISAGRWDPLVLVASLAVSLLLQIGANFANDVFDHLKGADVARRGPTRVTQSGILSPREMLASTAIIFGLAALIGLYLVYVGGVPFLVVGALAILSALAYTGGPYPLGYNGLGDLFVFIFFGVVGVVGTYYLHTLALDGLALAASLPVGLLIVNILVVNNLRDIETDRAAGKRTLAVRIGARATRRQYAAQLTLSYLVVAALLPWRGVLVLLPFVLAPAAWKLAHAVMTNADPPTFNRLLARSAQFSLQFGLLFALGLLVRFP